MAMGFVESLSPSQELNTGHPVGQEAVLSVSHRMSVDKMVFRGKGRDLCQPPHLERRERH